jgi:hypothetical protein
MNSHKNIITLLILFVCVSHSTLAQYNNQIAVGNYSAVHSYHFNPSWNARSAYLWQVNVFGVWGNVNNNYLNLKLPYSVYKIPNRIPTNYQTESGNPSFQKSWVSERLNGRNKKLSLSSDVFGPAAFVKIKTWRVGLFTHTAINVRVNNVNEALAHAAWMEFDSANGAYNLFNTNTLKNVHKFNVTGNSRATIGINLSKEIKMDWQRTFLIGASIKKVFGFQGFHFNASQINIQDLGNDSIYISPSNLNLVTYGDKMGSGAGVDLGITYVFHKKDSRRNGVYAQKHNKYFAKLGLAIMDIGSIKYKDAVFRTVSVGPNGAIVNLNSNAYSASSDYQTNIDTFMSQIGTYQSSVGNYQVGLPTRLVATADFQLKKNIYVATVLQQSLRSNASQHTRYQSFLMLSPRLEYRFFEFSMPLILEYDYRSLRLGSSFRLGPLYFGTNSLLSFINTRNIKDADVFLGVAFGNLEAFSFKKQVRKKLKTKSSKNNKNSCFSF